MKNKKKGKAYVLFSDYSENSDDSSENDFKFLKNDKKKIIIKQKRKKIYEKISWKELIENYEIIKIICGVIHKRNIQFDIQVKNVKNNSVSIIRMDNEKLKLIAPTLLCDFYESRLHFS